MSGRCSDPTNDPALSDRERKLESAILDLLAQRGNGKTICPSDAAKLVGGTKSISDWQPLMEPARAAARRLVKQGRVVITKKGMVIEPDEAKGPIRLRLA